MGFGNRVPTRRSKGSTTHEPAQGQPETACRSVRLERLVCIVRTRRRETARGGSVGKSFLVPLDCGQAALVQGAPRAGGGGHFAPPGPAVPRARLRSAARPARAGNCWLNCERVSSTAGASAPTRYQPGSRAVALARTTSRSRRRRRLRETADPTDRPRA